jgi:hypothetical protein
MLFENYILIVLPNLNSGFRAFPFRTHTSSPSFASGVLRKFTPALRIEKEMRNGFQSQARLEFRGRMLLMSSSEVAEYSYLLVFQVRPH